MIFAEMSVSGHDPGCAAESYGGASSTAPLRSTAIVPGPTLVKEGTIMFLAVDTPVSPFAQPPKWFGITPAILRIGPRRIQPNTSGCAMAARITCRTRASPLPRRKASRVYEQFFGGAFITWSALILRFGPGLQPIVSLVAYSLFGSLKVGVLIWPRARMVFSWRITCTSTFQTL